MLIKIIPNVYINLKVNDILKILSIPIHEHGMQDFLDIF